MKKTLAAAALALAFALPAPAEEATLRVHHFASPAAAAHQLLVAPWANRLEKESAGRLRIEIFPAMALGGKPPQLVEQVRQGKVDAVFTLPAFTTGRFPRTEVFEMPFLHVDAMTSTLALQDYYEKHLQQEYRDYQVLLLHAHDGAVLHANKPIRTLEDFKGLKILTANRGGGIFLRGVGATAVGAPPAELSQMLSKGLLDGALLPYGSAAAHGARELLHHHVTLGGARPRLGTSVFAFLMNKASYAALPAPLRRLVDAHSGRHLAWYAGKSWAEAEQPGMAAARAAQDHFLTVASGERARIRAAVEPEIQLYLAETSRREGFDAASLYADAKAMIARYRE